MFASAELREPTSFGGPTVHVVELILEYTLGHHLVQYLMPFHPDCHKALGAFDLVGDHPSAKAVKRLVRSQPSSSMTHASTESGGSRSSSK